jgi:hypothetical protein
MITRLQNKNYIENTISSDFIQKYKFIYIESNYKEEMFNMIYARLCISWNYDKENKYLMHYKYLYHTLHEFLNQFNIEEFKDIYSATEFMYNENTINSYLNMDNILYINKYQLYWDYLSLEVRKKYGCFKKIKTNRVN